MTMSLVLPVTSPGALSAVPGAMPVDPHIVAGQWVTMDAMSLSDVLVVPLVGDIAT